MSLPVSKSHHCDAATTYAQVLRDAVQAYAVRTRATRVRRAKCMCLRRAAEMRLIERDIVLGPPCDRDYIRRHRAEPLGSA